MQQVPSYCPGVHSIRKGTLSVGSSADTQVFRIPSLYQPKSSGQCSFSYQAPAVWNHLPVSVLHSNTVSFSPKKTLSSVPMMCACVCVCVCVCFVCTESLKRIFKECLCPYGLWGLGKCSRYPLLLISLKENWSKDASWPKTKENVQIFPCAGFK